MGGGAWPFLVGGVICLVNSVNERDLDLLNSHARCPSRHGAVDFLEGLLVSNQSQEGNNRSVMPLDVLGRTRATLTVPESALSFAGRRGQSCKRGRAGDRSLQFSILNEEFLVSASHQLALITSLPFVHTARRYYRLNGLVRPPDWRRCTAYAERRIRRKVGQLDHLEEVKVVTRFP